MQSFFWITTYMTLGQLLVFIFFTRPFLLEIHRYCAPDFREQIILSPNDPSELFEKSIQKFNCRRAAFFSFGLIAAILLYFLQLKPLAFILFAMQIAISINIVSETNISLYLMEKILSNKKCIDNIFPQILSIIFIRLYLILSVLHFQFDLLVNSTLTLAMIEIVYSIGYRSLDSFIKTYNNPDPKNSSASLF